MNKQEMIDFLRNNLRVEVNCTLAHMCQCAKVYVSLYLCGEQISESCEKLPDTDPDLSRWYEE